MNSPQTDPLPIDSPERRRLPPLLRQCWFSLNQAFRRRIKDTGLTPDQFTVLRTLVEGDLKGLTQREIARIISSDPNTIASLLERMESSGLVERKEHERDRRAHRIVVLAEGKKTYKVIREVAVKLQQEILAELPSEEREGFLKNLAIVADACRRAAENSPRKGKTSRSKSERNDDA